jgi:hypothetical protein
MHYHSIVEANIIDAIRHLSDAKRMRDPEKIGQTTRYLNEMLFAAEKSDPKIFEKYKHLLAEQIND